MFKIGDVIVYSSQGICKIDRIEPKQIGKAVADYYVLKPCYNQSTAVFVPVNNDVLTAKMQDILTRKQAQALIKNAPNILPLEFSDENQKREQYKEILASTDRERLLALIKTIRNEKNIRRQNNKKLNINDEQTLRKAEMLIFNELAYIFEVSVDQAQNMINL